MMKRNLRQMLIGAVVLAGAMGVGADTHKAASAGTDAHKPAVAAAGPTPQQVLTALGEGNARFAAGTSQDLRRDQTRRCETFAGGQHPVASILTCADSRVPPELVFDQGVGDLFVIRVAGNVADVDEVGTIEYGVGHLHTPVVVVLGHTKCGAVTAVAEKAEVHGCIGQLVDNIVPAVEKATKLNPGAKGDSLVAAATRQNVWQSVEDMLGRSELLCEAVSGGSVKLVGAIYDIHTGTVEWMGPHPQEAALIKNAKPAAQPKAPGHAAPPAAAPKPAGDRGHSGHTEAAPAEPGATASAEKRPPDNFLALGGMLAAGAVVSGLAIHFFCRQ